VGLLIHKELAHAVRLRILACRNDLNRKRIFSLQLTAHSWWLLSSYRLSSPRQQILHIRSGWRLTFPSLWRSFIQLSFWTGVRMLCEKDRKRNNGTEWRIYYSNNVLPPSSPR